MYDFTREKERERECVRACVCTYSVYPVFRGESGGPGGDMWAVALSLFTCRNAGATMAASPSHNDVAMATSCESHTVKPLGLR
jgi:hypothetical protein